MDEGPLRGGLREGSVVSRLGRARCRGDYLSKLKQFSLNRERASPPTPSTQLPALRKRIETLKSLMADMKTGERLTFSQEAGGGIQVNVGGTAKGMNEGDDFARAFLSIRLGAHPPNAGLKAGLLGGAGS